ncbi:hypothetical protein [Cellulosimicrobium protaetiae]|uniref:Integral membrane protein n=1 Tax=Cellulosimicrobium protaetiae TaxID=2587808 RepID=A0A6M5UHS7_9MICO|nr:hypothetical protein [Cellulosimicrobium protaetiae]QJW36129.1 hypothetical protein FIC82_007855 [Cellulosimicrobium protaetiae]
MSAETVPERTREATAPAAPARPRRAVPGWVRWTAGGLLLLLGGVLAIAALVARYADGTLLDTDRYVAIVRPLASDESVRAQVVDTVTDQVMARVDVETMTADALDGLAASIDPTERPILSDQATQRSEAAAAALAPLLYDQVERLVRGVVERVVGSQAFATAWEQVNRTGHRAVVYVVTGEGDVVRASEDGVVRLSLGPVVDDVRTALQLRGFSFAERIPDLDPQLTLGQFPQVTVVQTGVAWLGRAAAWLPWIVVGLAALAVWVAPERRRGVALVAGTWTAAGLLLVGAIAFGRAKYLEALPPAVAENATGVVYDRLLGPLRVDGWWLAAVGVVLLAGVLLWPALRTTARRHPAGTTGTTGPTSTTERADEATAPAVTTTP